MSTHGLGEGTRASSDPGAGPLLTDVIRLIFSVMSSDTPEHVVDRVLAFLKDEGGAPHHRKPHSLAESSLQWLQADEEEINFVALTRLYRGMLERADQHASLKHFLVEVATSYVRATEYLFPLLLGFARSAHALSQKRESSPSIHVFLRDALFFVPPLLSIPRARENVDLLVYTRPMHKDGTAPRLVRERADGSFTECSDLFLRNGLVVDGGLYGSLIAGLLEKEHCSPGLGVFFFGSRNPFIAGWLNLRFADALVRGETVDLVDIVRLVDTIESLFKPFRMQPHAPDGPLRVELAEPITLTCSLLYLWSLARYCEDERRRLEDPLSLGLRALEATKSSPDSWFLFNQVPKWRRAEEFIDGWKYGPLAPMDRLCGLRLD